MVEPAFAASDRWSVQRLLPELRLDLEDLQLGPPAEQPAIADFTTESARVGALYVLEGSALGAHLLLRRAVALGLGMERGARHLARQVGSPHRWREFLLFLDEQRNVDRPAVLAAAHGLFERALSVYSGAR